MVDTAHTRARARTLSLTAATIVIGCLAVGHASAAPGSGNSANAKLCQKGGWQMLVRSDNAVFSSEKACVSYAAGGGTLVVDSPLLSCKRQLAQAGLTAPADANFVLGTANADDFSGSLTDGNDVVCGFGGNDAITNTTLAFGDILLGGDANDSVSSVQDGTFVDVEVGC